MPSTNLSRFIARSARSSLIVSAIALAATVLITIIVARSVEEQEQARFFERVEIVISSIEQRMKVYIDTLLATAALFSTAEEEITQETFRRFVRQLEMNRRYPGVRSIGWSPRIDSASMDDFLAAARRDTAPDYHIWPEGERLVYQPVLYTELISPLSAPAPGYDMYVEQRRRTAMDQARDSGAPVLTTKLALITEPNLSRRDGFLLFAPVYATDSIPQTVTARREQLRGFVFSAFSAEDLIRSLFGLVPQTTIAFEIFDGNTLEPDHLLVDVNTISGIDEPQTASLTTEHHLLVAEQIWTLRFRSTPQFEQSSRRFLVPLTAALGVAFTGLLAIVTWSEGRARLNAEQRNRELHASRNALAEADRRKNEFLALLGHELRNPLAPIHSGLELLTKTQAIPDHADLLAMMLRHTQHMVRLVDDLLDVSRITRGKIELRPRNLDFRNIIRQAIAATVPFCESAQHKLEVTLPKQPVPLIGDDVRLLQSVENLLSNAFKYTATGGRVMLSVHIESERAVLRIRDTGIGIEPALLPHIFEPFIQAGDSPQHSLKGLGIGLTLVKAIIELHDGIITAASEGPGRGSEFTVSLPLQTNASVTAAASFEEPEADAPTPANRHHHILIVDDNRDAVIALENLLKLAGYTTHVAHNGQAALQAVTDFQANVVILDIGLPDMDGYQVARELRTRENGDELLIIGLSGYGETGHESPRQTSDLDHYLLKPASIDTLAALIEGRQNG